MKKEFVYLAIAALLLGLMLVDQRLDNRIQVALHELSQLVHSEIDAVIADTPLGKIIGPDAG